MKTLKTILMYIWQLPQNLLGLFLILFYKVGFGCQKYTTYKGIKYYAAPQMPSGISLGQCVIFNKEFSESSNSFNHEYGHTRQSKYLGWFYLIIIGLPSLCGNIWDRIAHKNWDWRRSAKWYYSQPWEYWADKLGGVVRVWS